MRKNRFALLAGAALMAMTFGASVSAAGFAPDVVKSYSQGEKASYLAGAHGKMGLNCETCHVGDKVSDSETEINAKCTTCHNPADLAKKTEKEGLPNPHKSHLGDVQCTACHSGHNQSVAYCSNCHDFPSMKDMKYGKGAKVASQYEDLSAYDNAKPERTETTDLLVVGSGAAGFVAAFTAQEAGVKNIVMVEKMAVPGGNSQLAAGGMNAAGTRFQKAKNINDNPDMMFKDTMKGGRGKNDPALVRILAEESAAGVKWLEDMGADLSDVKRSGGATVDRTHRPHGGMSVGPHIVDVLRAQATKEGVGARVNSRAVKLLLDKDYKIAGAIVHGKHSGYYKIAAKAVVLATGGYGQNKEMIAVYRPTFKDMTSSNNVTSTGDGIKMALNIGASMTDIDWVQAHPTVGLDSRILISETVRGVGAIMVNVKGARFVNELTTRDRASDAILHQPERRAWLVFDNDLYKSAKMVRGYDHLGMLKKADTVAELAKLCGMDAKTLEETVKSYNKFKKAGKDEAFGRPDMPLGVEKAPFYAVAVAPGIHHTMGGVAITTESEVLDIQSRPIPGLYAAGEVTGGVHGFNRLGGNAIADTVVFGRRSGEHAAKYALGKK